MEVINNKQNLYQNVLVGNNLQTHSEAKNASNIHTMIFHAHKKVLIT